MFAAFYLAQSRRLADNNAVPAAINTCCALIVSCEYACKWEAESFPEEVDTSCTTMTKKTKIKIISKNQFMRYDDIDAQLHTLANLNLYIDHPTSQNTDTHTCCHSHIIIILVRAACRRRHRHRCRPERFVVA